MKYLIIIITGFVLSVNSVQAQTWDEWFRQKKTQKKYLVQQIAALQVYLGYVKKGYRIARQGLNLIGDIKDGNFNLHKDYFGSLAEVNPAIANSAKVAEIIILQKLIMRDFGGLYEDCKQDENFTSDEAIYIGRVYQNLLKECEAALDELEIAVTDNKAEMEDNERIERIDKIHREMKDRYAFAREFVNGARLLAAQRARENRQIEVLRRNHNL